MVNRSFVNSIEDALNIALDSFSLGIRALESVRELNRNGLTAAFRLIGESHGKLVVFGVGKSGLIGRKIAATLSSLGTPAVNIHPGEALHGDIGLLADDDVALLISRSGETDELLALLPVVKRVAAPIIAICGKPESTLAKAADIVLTLPDIPESGHLDIAPTTSTLATLAIGDALAVGLCYLRGFTEDDYALLHPAGALGRRLTLRVADLMVAGVDNPVLTPDAPLNAVIREMTEKPVGGVNIIDGDGMLVGIITEGDLRRALGQNVDITVARAGDIMTREPVSVHADEKAYDALLLMEKRRRQISVLPVVSDGMRCVGMLRLHDLVRAGL